MIRSSLIKVVTGLARGGAETQLKEVALRLHRRGWKVQIVSMLPPTAFADELRAAGIPVLTLEMRRKRADPRALIRFVAILRRVRPTIVHSYLFHANLLTRLARHFVRVPVVVNSVRSITEGAPRRMNAYRFTNYLCDLTTQVCQEGLERYVREKIIPSDKIVWVPNGIDTSFFRPYSNLRAPMRASFGYGDEPFVWIAVGRLEEPKDYPSLLRAFAQVLSHFSGTRLWIIGEGAQRDFLQQYAAQLKITGAVEFLGLRRDVASWLNAADAYVMSSAWEGMSNALLEAASTALPIVATDVGGNREIVLHEQSGYLVPPHNSEALAEAMLRLMMLPEHERLEMGQAGRAHVVANFEIEQIVDRWEQLYNQLLEQKGIPLCRE